MMRILSGYLKGRSLKTIQTDALRPTGARVRKAIFDVLDHNDINYDHVLDLYAGVGTLGIQALSHGAKSCVFLDKCPSTVLCLKENLSKFNLLDHTTVIQGDVLHNLSRLEQQEQSPFDLVFMDPPYHDYPEGLLSLLLEKKIISKNSFLVVEHHKTTQISLSHGLKCAIKKTYGHTSVSFLTLKEKRA